MLLIQVLIIYFRINDVYNKLPYSQLKGVQPNLLSEKSQMLSYLFFSSTEQDTLTTFIYWYQNTDFNFCNTAIGLAQTCWVFYVVDPLCRLSLKFKISARSVKQIIF